MRNLLKEKKPNVISFGSILQRLFFSIDFMFSCTTSAPRFTACSSILFESSTPDIFLKPGTFYQIPYRCLIPKNIDNLLLAGRCISATHEACGSIRIMPCCMATGQAAGTAAALSIKKKISPRNLDISLLQKVLKEQEAYLNNKE